VPPLLPPFRRLGFGRSACPILQCLLLLLFSPPLLLLLVPLLLLLLLSFEVTREEGAASDEPAVLVVRLDRAILSALWKVLVLPTLIILFVLLDGWSIVFVCIFTQTVSCRRWTFMNFDKLLARPGEASAVSININGAIFVSTTIYQHRHYLFNQCCSQVCH